MNFATPSQQRHAAFRCIRHDERKSCDGVALFHADAKPINIVKGAMARAETPRANASACNFFKPASVPVILIRYALKCYAERNEGSTLAALTLSPGLVPVTHHSFSETGLRMMQETQAGAGYICK